MNDYEPMPHRSNRNTKKWCRGKPGIQHNYTWMLWSEYKKLSYLKDWDIEVCYNCNKTRRFRHHIVAVKLNLV